VADRITYVGHATALFELGGVRLITDPLLRNRFMHVPRHVPAPGPAVARDIDAVLISHLHHDHLDPPSLQMIGRDIDLIGPDGAAKLLGRRGFENVTELVPGGSAGVGDVDVVATTAVHDARRYKFGRHVPALGYMLESRGRRIYFAGDTDLFDEMIELGAVDVALLPVAGWGPRVGRGHLDPERAARAAAIIKPRVVIPIHWGSFLSARLVRRRPEILTEPPRKLGRLLAELAPDVELALLEPGQALEV
jgi:L-ascorbate metabolism protein UlaG (beta-lactamase superfamily)